MKSFSFFSCVLLTQFAFGQETTESNSLESKNSTEHLSAMEVIVSPNPATDKCSISGAEGATCTLYSSSGTYVGKWVFDDSKTVLLTDLPTGVFQAIIEKNGVTIVKRIVII